MTGQIEARLGMLCAAAGLVPLALTMQVALATGEEPGGPPIELGLEEHVEVQLVLIDVLVLDRRDRTIADLSVADFELHVDGKPVEIESLDVRCPLGSARDARSAWGPDSPGLPIAAPAPDTRIVFVFDYFHMQSAAEALQAASAALEARGGDGVEHMVVSLGQVLRIEAQFTRDAAKIRQVFERMRVDPALYAGNYGRLTERRFFDRLQMLLDLLERVPGRKAVVLFSGPFQPDGFHHDPAYRSLSALSATSRTAVYPVDTGGLRTLLDPLNTRLGGPAMLRRLANETGGRMTADTNDLTLAYARARRDLGCTYTLGFSDRNPRPDRSRRVFVGIRGTGGLRAVYPSFYVLRSREEKRKSLADTAAMAPEMFPSQLVNASVFLFRPATLRRWEAAMGVEVRPEALRSGGPWELVCALRDLAGRTVHSFKRRIQIPEPMALGGRPPAATVFEAFKVEPGRYTTSAVLSGSAGSVVPLATRSEVVIPDMPQGGLFLVGPIPGRRPASPAAPTLAELDATFEPLVRLEIDPAEPLAFLTHACEVGAGVSFEKRLVEREITAAGGATLETFLPAELELGGEGRVRCQALVDWLPAGALDPGSYGMTASSRVGRTVLGRASVAFTIRPAGD